MSRLTLDPSTLRVESFGEGIVPIIVGTSATPTYPDCPTATGCTCIEACQSVVETCPPPVTGTGGAE